MIVFKFYLQHCYYHWKYQLLIAKLVRDCVRCAVRCCLWAVRRSLRHTAACPNFRTHVLIPAIHFVPSTPPHQSTVDSKHPTIPLDTSHKAHCHTSLQLTSTTPPHQSTIHKKHNTTPLYRSHQAHYHTRLQVTPSTLPHQSTDHTKHSTTPLHRSHQAHHHTSLQNSTTLQFVTDRTPRHSHSSPILVTNTIHDYKNCITIKETACCIC